MALLPQTSLPTFQLSQFDFDKVSRELVGEASTIQRGGQVKLFGQVFDDACDQGLVIQSHRTGKYLTFVVDKVDQDREGEIQGWWLKPLNSMVQLKVLIIND